MPALHNKIIATAAKAALGPQNFRQKGSSRMWLSDHGWWLRVVEFQPSAWSKGSYLNVGAHWLWSEGRHLTLDFGGRVVEHQQYESDEQFKIAAFDLAKQGAISAEDLSGTFPSPEAAADLLVHDVRTGKNYRNGHPIWAAYNAGIAAGFVGRMTEATEMFALVKAYPATEGSIPHLSVAKLENMLSDSSVFKNKVASLIDQRRAALKLPKRSMA
jgi:hypothetical protein